MLLAAALFGSVVLHELAHALVARGRRVDVDEIALFVFGGVAKLRDEPRDPLSDLLIAAAGPATSLALGVGTLAALAFATTLGAAAPVVSGLRWIGTINVVLALFNAVPAFPLDGGRVLRAIVWWSAGDYDRATVVAARVGRAFAALLIGTGFVLAATRSTAWLWEVVIGWFLWMTAGQALRGVALRRAVKDVTVRELMTKRVPSVRSDHDVRVASVQTRDFADEAEIAVIDRSGLLVGVVEIGALRTEGRANPERPVLEITRTPTEGQILPLDAPAAGVLEQIGRLGDQLPLVIDGGRLVGTIDPRRLIDAIEAARS